jgi:hypothetical protein
VVLPAAPLPSTPIHRVPGRPPSRETTQLTASDRDR